METIVSEDTGRLIAVGIAPGEMLLETIEAAIEKHGIRNGAVVSGIGTLKSCQMHYITHTGFPPTDQRYLLKDEPLELLSVAGLIADGEPHLHVVVSKGEGQVWGGHLHEESEVLYLAEILIRECNDLEMLREYDAERKIALLKGKT
ncbi:MAG: PPC domain-containing DNA-binding protein [Candidatus Sumerlaeota bacterium]